MTLSTKNIFLSTGNLPECEFPILHSAGTSKEQFIKQYENARQKLDQLSVAIANISCQEIDYVMHEDPDTVFEDAYKTRRIIFDLLDEIESYLFDHLMHIKSNQ